MRLYHFSEDGSIDHFEPRPVLVPSPRRPGEEWLNGPLVWAVTEDHEFTFLFPRDTARVLLWATRSTTAADRSRWLPPRGGPVAYVEQAGLDAMGTTTLFRYEVPTATFEPTSDAWMRVSRHLVVPTSVVRFDDLPRALAALHVEVRVCDDLNDLRDAWASTVHASGFRLRNSETWRPDSP